MCVPKSTCTTRSLTHKTLQTIISVSFQATVFSNMYAKPSAMGSTTESDMLNCEKALSISTMSNHITALQLKYVWCLFWLLSGIWGSSQQSKLWTGKAALCVSVCVSACVCLCVCICMPRLCQPQDWCWRQNESQSVCYSLPAAHQEVS